MLLTFTMADILNYFKVRKIATIVAVIVLICCSIIYFSTNVAERNNEMMYKEIYGENATQNNMADVNATDTIQTAKTELV